MLFNTDQIDLLLLEPESIFIQRGKGVFVKFLLYPLQHQLIRNECSVPGFDYVNTVVRFEKAVFIIGY